MSKILVIVAHPDDEILGLGATIKKFSQEGHEINCIILGEGITSREEREYENKIKNLHANTFKAAREIGYQQVIFSNLPDNRFDRIDLLDIIKEIEKYIEILKPDIIYTHHEGDLNIDHRKTYEAVLTACRPIGEYSVKEIYTFETPSSTEWNFSTLGTEFVPNVFVDINHTFQDKLKAMSYYTSEIRDYPHPRSLEALEIIAKRWGTVVGKHYVEAFKLIRKID